MRPKLLVIEFWGIGDLAIATPFLQAATAKYDVTLLAKPFACDLQKRFWPDVKVVPFFAPWSAFKGKYRFFSWPWRRLFRLWRQLSAARFDVGLSARWDPRDHLLLRLVGAKRRLGFPRLQSGRWLTQPLPLPEPNAHRYESWLSLARALKLELPSKDQLDFQSCKSSAQILMHSGAGQPVRVWPLARFKNLVNRMRDLNYEVQVACDPDQRQWWLDAGEKNVATPQSISELLKIIEESVLFIGNDSGPGHVAAVSGHPTFTIFGPQLPERFAPLHPQAEFIEGKPCPYKPCSDYCRFPAPLCILDISEIEVWERLEKFIGRTLRASSAVSPKTDFRPLRIIQVFNRYLYPGGEEKSVARIALDLEAAGHQVTRFWRSSEEWNLPSAPAKWKQLFLLWNNPAVLGELQRLQEKEKADVWILHNVLPVISIGIYRLASELKVPIFQWLHNYRPISPSGTLVAGNKMLESNDPFIAFKETWHGSWRGVFLTGWLSLAYAIMKRRGDFSSVRAWIAVSDEVKSIFLKAGWPKEKLFTVRHSWHIQPVPLAQPEPGHFLFLGRMVEMKGVRFLVDLWKNPALKNFTLIMAGQGSTADELKNQSPPNIRWVGHVEGEDKQKLIADCRAILFPGLWPEPLSTVAYEAYQMEKTILASNLGGMKELIRDGETGLLLPPGDSQAWLNAIVSLNAEEARRLGANGRIWLEKNVSPELWGEQFNGLAQRVLSR